MKGRLLNSAGWPLACALAWLWTWRHLAQEWSVNPQYQYGFAVPFLFFYMARQRWCGPMQLRGGLACWLAVVAAWLALFLGELLRWQDPIWRFTGSVMLLGSFLLTAAWFFRRGGWPLLVREAFPLGFAWLSLPWPIPIEQILTQKLLLLVTGAAVTAANSFGIAALQRGNLIELANGFIGMADACSGMESFQSSLMASLFLGELFRLDAGRRCGLVAGGWVLAFSGNLARVYGLLLVLHNKGQEAVSGCHDLFGALATIFTFLGIFGVAAFISAPPAATTEAPITTATLCEKKTGWLLCLAFASIPLLAAAWFSALSVPAAELPDKPRWQLSNQRLPFGWTAEPREPSARQRASLQFSQWNCLLLKTPEGRTAQIVHLFWEPGKSMPAMAFYHTPALCLSTTGWKQIAPPQATVLKFKDEQIQCVRYSLEQDEIRQSVYQSLSSGGKTRPFFVDPNEIGNRRARLSMLWKEPRRQVGEELLLYMPTLDNADAQDAAAQELLEAVLRTTDSR